MSDRCSTTSISKSSSEIPLPSLVEIIKKKHVLLLHAGGDSKRVPWANPMGKVFLPLPYLAADDPDGSVPLLFDHILAIASCARQAFQNKGYLFCPVSCDKMFLGFSLAASYVMLSPVMVVKILGTAFCPVARLY